MTGTLATMIELAGVTKRFGSTVALDGVDLSIGSGHIVGLLGANGSGKTTLLRHVLGLYLPDAGTCCTFGCDPADLTPALMSRIGYVDQEGELPGWMTVRQLIAYVRAYYACWNASLEERLVSEFELPLKTRVGGLSPGVRQRLAILLAVCFEPELLILDEPASGLDPIARGQFLDFLLEIIQSPERTVIISSHILSDVEKVIDHAVILHRGRVLRDVPFADLQEEFSRVLITAAAPLPDPLPFRDVLSIARAGHDVDAIVRRIDVENIPAFEAAYDATVEVRGLGLEDLYRQVMRYEGREH